MEDASFLCGSTYTVTTMPRSPLPSSMSVLAQRCQSSTHSHADNCAVSIDLVVDGLPKPGQASLAGRRRPVEQTGWASYQSALPKGLDLPRSWRRSCICEGRAGVARRLSQEPLDADFHPPDQSRSMSYLSQGYRCG